MQRQIIRFCEYAAAAAFVLMGIICSIAGIHDGNVWTMILGVLFLLQAGLTLGVKPTYGRWNKEGTKAKSMNDAGLPMMKKLRRIITVIVGYSMMSIYTTIGIMIFIPGILRPEAGLIVFGIVFLAMAATLFFRLPMRLERRAEKKRLKTGRKRQQGFDCRQKAAAERLPLRIVSGGRQEERYTSEAENPSLQDIIRIMTDNPHRSRMNRCDGNCANCPPHYGYRYGRWYYGHHHRHGCEFGGNKGI